MRFQLQKFHQQWFLIVISFVISELFIINKLYYMLFLPLSLLIFLLYWQRQFWYIFLVGLGVILHLVITKFSWQPPFHQSGILTGKISYVGNHYYFIKIGLKEYYYAANITLHLGDKINFQGYLTNLPTSGNIYQFNFKDWLHSNDIEQAIKIQKIINIQASNDLRETVSNYLKDQDVIINGMISLLLYGERTAAVNTLYNNFVCLGVIHLLVVSGYHINVLFLLLNKLLKRIIPRQGSWILTCGILLFYLYLLNFDLTTLKAVIILFVSLFNTNFCKNKFNHNQRWCASFLLTLLAYPSGFLTVGFIYGFSMTLLFANLWSKIRPLAYWQQLLILNGFIFLVASGWNIYFNFSVNFTSILFNIILTPVIAIIYIINFIIVFIKPLHLCYTWFYFILHHYSLGLLKINFAWNVGALNFAVICCYYLLLLLACYYIKYLKKVFISLFVILIGVMFSFNFLVKPAYSITMLNVGNGQTIIMEDKWHSKVIAFDLGVGYGASSTLVSDYLRWKGINWINMVFISHRHDDHNNNLSDVQKKIWIFKLLNNDSVIEKYQIGDFTLQVLHHFENAGDENNNSLVILGTINKHHFLLMGDASKTVENKILNFLWPPIDLLQVSHHGSKSASSEEFISKIKPKTCFISGANDNHHKFPAPQTLNTLKQYHCQIYQTNISHNLVYNINESAKSYLTTF